ncbi:MAG: hypothetical protein AB8F95_11370 [Bacteroidia bacterium]
MKKLILFIVCMGAFTYGFTQTHQFKFPNGVTKKFSFDYDDPLLLPKWQVEYHFFGFSVDNITNEASGNFQLKPILRLSDRLWLEGQLTAPYGRGADGSIDYRNKQDETKRLSIDFAPLAHFKLWNSVKPRKKKIAIDYEYSGNTTDMYVVKIPRNIEHAIELDAGFYFNRSNIHRMPAQALQLSTESDTSFLLSRFNSTSIVAGFSYRKSQSFQMKTDGVTRRYWSYMRFFGNLSYALTGNTYVNQLFIPPGGSYSDQMVTPVQDGFVKPDLSRLGWRIGVDMVSGFKNSSLGFVLGFEVGKIPYFTTVVEERTYQTNENLFMVHFGFTFGKMPYKL